MRFCFCNLSYIRVLFAQLPNKGQNNNTILYTITRESIVRTAGEAGQVAWRIPGASAAGIVRSGPGAGRDVREWEDRNGLCFRTRCHRRRDGTAEQASGRRAVATDRRDPAARREGGSPGGGRPRARRAGGGSGADGHDVYQQCGAVDYNRFRRSSRHGVHHGRQHRGIWANERRGKCVRPSHFGGHPAGRDFPE